MGQKIRIAESKLRSIIKESVEEVLNEISFGMARDAFKRAGENFDKDLSLYDNPRKRAQFDNLHQHFSDKSRENFNPDMPVLVCLDDRDETYTAGELGDHFEITGYVEPSRNPIYAGQKMIGYPYLKGLIGPMWDGNRLRYETQKVYDLLSM